MGWIAGAYRLGLDDDRAVLAAEAMPAVIVQIQRCGAGVLFELDDHRLLYADDFLGAPRWVGQLQPTARYLSRPDVRRSQRSQRSSPFSQRAPRALVPTTSASQIQVRDARVLVGREGALLQGRCGAELEPVPFQWLSLAMTQGVAAAISDDGSVRRSTDMGRTWVTDAFETPLDPERVTLWPSGVPDNLMLRVDGVVHGLREGRWHRIADDLESYARDQPQPADLPAERGELVAAMERRVESDADAVEVLLQAVRQFQLPPDAPLLRPFVDRHAPEIGGYLKHRDRSHEAVLALLRTAPAHASLLFDTWTTTEAGGAGCGAGASAQRVWSSVDVVASHLSPPDEAAGEDLYLEEAGVWRRAPGAVPGRCVRPVRQLSTSGAEGCVLLPGPELLLRCDVGEYEPTHVYRWTDRFEPVELARGSDERGRDEQWPIAIAPLQALDARELLYSCGASICLQDLASNRTRRFDRAMDEVLWVEGGWVYGVNGPELARQAIESGRTEVLVELPEDVVRFDRDPGAAGLTAYRADGTSSFVDGSSGWEAQPDFTLRAAAVSMRRASDGAWASRSGAEPWRPIERPGWASQTSRALEVTSTTWCSGLGCRLARLDLAPQAPSVAVAQVQGSSPPPALRIRCAERRSPRPLRPDTPQRIRWAAPWSDLPREALVPAAPRGGLHVLHVEDDEALVAVSGPSPGVSGVRSTSAVCVHRVTADGAAPGPCIDVGRFIERFLPSAMTVFRYPGGWVINLELVYAHERTTRWIGLDSEAREVWRRELPTSVALQTFPGASTAPRASPLAVPARVCAEAPTERGPMHIRLTNEFEVADVWTGREDGETCVSDVRWHATHLRAVDGRLEGVLSPLSCGLEP